MICLCSYWDKASQRRRYLLSSLQLWRACFDHILFLYLPHGNILPICPWNDGNMHLWAGQHQHLVLSDHTRRTAGLENVTEKVAPIGVASSGGGDPVTRICVSLTGKMRFVTVDGRHIEMILRPVARPHAHADQFSQKLLRMWKRRSCDLSVVPPHRKRSSLWWGANGRLSSTCTFLPNVEFWPYKRTTKWHPAQRGCPPL